MHGMQQRLAVASVLVLVLLAGASAVLIQSHVYGQSQPTSSAQSQTAQNSSTGTTSSTSTTNGGSLLTTATHQSGHSDDGNESEIETELDTNSTMDS